MTSLASLEPLFKTLGKHGEKIYYSARGIDNDEITEYHDIKSIGEQTTFDQNTLSAEAVCDKMTELSGMFLKDLKKADFLNLKL